MTDEEIARILSPEYKAWILSPDRFDDAVVLSSGDVVWNDMFGLGIAEFWTDTLTEKGLRVRAILEKQDADA